MMPSLYRQICPLVFLFIDYSHAFYCGLKCNHSISTYPSGQSLLYVGEPEDAKREEVVDRDRRQSPLIQQQRKRQRRRRTNHQESHVTAVGVESLFSIFSLWSFSSKTTTKGETPLTDLTARADLPPIDCEWACTSDEEKVHLQQMKLLLETELETIVKKELHLLYPDVYSDLRLLRFLRKSKQRDVVSSAERYISFLKWREENNVDEIRAMVESTSASSFTPSDDRLRTIATYFPMNFDYVVGTTSGLAGGNNKGSNTVRQAILYVGLFDTLGISEKIVSTQSNISLDDFLNYWIYLYESIHFQLYHQTVHFGEMMFLDEVCDLSGLSIQQFSPYFVTKVMKPWLRMTQSNYPETTSRIYILNPPRIVNLAWKLVTPLLSQGTVDKIRFEKNFKGSADDFCDDGDYLK